MLVKTEALSRALKLLAAAGCEYAVIDSSGQKYGSLEVARPSVKRNRNHPAGTFLDYHKPMTEALQAGQSKLVPFGPFVSAADRDSLRSSISGYCSREWGSGTYITAIAKDGIEVLRVE